MHKQINSVSKTTFESKWKLMWIFKQGINIAVTDVVLIVDGVKAIVGAVDVVVVVAAVVVVVARKQSKLIDGSPKIKMKEFYKKKSFIFNVQCLI